MNFDYSSLLDICKFVLSISPNVDKIFFK